MIQQVRDIHTLSAEWYLTKDERINLYVKCAQALDNHGDSTGAFKVFFQAFKIIQLLPAKETTNKKVEAEQLVLAALKSPEVINLEELMTLDAVKDLKNSSKEIFAIVDAVVSSDMKAFSKELDKYKKYLDSHKVSKQMMEEKKRFVLVCTLNIESSTGKVLKFKELADLIGLGIDDVEEWAINAINHNIIDGRIDQINETLVIKTHKLRTLNKDEWLKIKSNVTTWKQRFSEIENVLKHQPATN